MDRRLAGTRRAYVEVQSVIGRTRKGDGYVDSWATYATAWVQVQPLPFGSDQVVANITENSVTHQVRLDWAACPDLRPEHRLLYEGRALYIRDRRDEEERHVTWMLVCEERIP